LLTQTRQPRILVWGDVMLDRYLWGEVDRISPEAPIPVLKTERTEDRLGGAGSVATMLAALDAQVTLTTVVGDDLEGRRVLELLAEANIGIGPVLRSEGRPTTVKQRLLGKTAARHPQQMIRIDRESKMPVDEQLAGRLLEVVRRQLDRVDLVMISDYGKGVCEDGLLRQLIHMCRAAGVPIIADPIRDADYARYAGCNCITPNRTEASDAIGRPITTIDEGLDAAAELTGLDIGGVAVTLDRDGIAWADRHGNRRQFPVRAREVCDITGAGDMVAAALCYAFASGADWKVACELANLSAGLEVERLGVVPLSRHLLLAELEPLPPTATPADPSTKLVSVETLQAELDRRRGARQCIAMTNGCFDLLHPGHVASLQFARAQGDCLVVGLNSDRSIRALKGPARPLLDEQARAAMLAALACVDYVVLFHEASVERLVGQVLPDVLVKASQYTVEEVVGHEIVERHGGRVALFPMEGEYSTTELIERIRAADSSDRAVA
jgi:D-beta-D-heptose 7-phosphate kinase/D-beta-D-heptose 1-phosphate adenosyltransferase